MIGCVDCARYRQEIAELRREYGQTISDAHMVAVRTKFGLTATLTQLVLILFVAGDWVSSRSLEKRFDKTADTIKVHICRIRRLVGHDFVETSYAVGYRLSDEGMVRVDAALKESRTLP